MFCYQGNIVWTTGLLYTEANKYLIIALVRMEFASKFDLSEYACSCINYHFKLFSTVKNACAHHNNEFIN